MDKWPDEKDNPINPLYVRRVLARHPGKETSVCSTLKRQMINAGMDSKAAKKILKRALYELRGSCLTQH